MKNPFAKLKTAAQIAKLYKQLSKKHHPDIAGEQSTAKMQEITKQRDDAMRSVLKKQGMGDSDIESFISREHADALDAFAAEALSHSGGITGFMKGNLDKITEQLVADADRTGKEPTPMDGIRAAFKMVFGEKELPGDLVEQLGLGEPSPDAGNEQGEQQDHDKRPDDRG